MRVFHVSVLRMTQELTADYLYNCKTIVLFCPTHDLRGLAKVLPIDVSFWLWL